MKSVLLAIAIVLALVGASQLPPGVTAAPAPVAANAPRLNVIFHGLFAFVVTRNDIEVLAPQVDDHVYKAGSWGNEMRLKEGEVYDLQGVHPAPAVPPIDPQSNLVLDKLSKPNHNKSKLFCSIKFPLPEEIIGLRRVSAEPGSIFTGKAAAKLQCKQIPLVLVFTYSLDESKKLTLGGKGFPWLPAQNAVKTVNLHVWAESEAVQSPMTMMMSPMQPFLQLVALFPNLDLQLKGSRRVDPDTVTNVRGLDPFEEKSLKERSVLVNAIPVAGTTPDPPPAGPLGGGAEVTTCVPLIVRADK